MKKSVRITALLLALTALLTTFSFPVSAAPQVPDWSALCEYIASARPEDGYTSTVYYSYRGSFINFPDVPEKIVITFTNGDTLVTADRDIYVPGLDETVRVYDDHSLDDEGNFTYYIEMGNETLYTQEMEKAEASFSQNVLEFIDNVYYAWAYMVDDILYLINPNMRDDRDFWLGQLDWDYSDFKLYFRQFSEYLRGEIKDLFNP